MHYRILLLSICLVLWSCGDSGNGTPTNTGTNTMTNSSSTNEDIAGIVTINANVRNWTDKRLVIDYSLKNIGSLELIVFDVGFDPTTGLDENGQVRLLKAKRDTGDTDFDQPPTIAGRNLSPDQTINGSANRRIPISIDYSSPPTVSSFTPEAIEFCVGYGNADDIISTTLIDGTYPLNEDLELQMLVCTVLSKPEP